MSGLCVDPACAQIREWYLADEVKLARIRTALNDVAQRPDLTILAIYRILNEEPQPPRELRMESIKAQRRPRP